MLCYDLSVSCLRLSVGLFTHFQRIHRSWFALRSRCTCARQQSWFSVQRKTNQHIIDAQPQWRTENKHTSEQLCDFIQPSPQNIQCANILDLTTFNNQHLLNPQPGLLTRSSRSLWSRTLKSGFGPTNHKNSDGRRINTSSQCIKLKPNSSKEHPQKSQCKHPNSFWKIVSAT